MLRIHFSEVDLARTRLAAAPDPLWEISTRGHPGHTTWPGREGGRPPRPGPRSPLVVPEAGRVAGAQGTRAGAAQLPRSNYHEAVLASYEEQMRAHVDAEPTRTAARWRNPQKTMLSPALPRNSQDLWIRILSHE